MKWMRRNTVNEMNEMECGGLNEWGGPWTDVNKTDNDNEVDNLTSSTDVVT